MSTTLNSEAIAAKTAALIPVIRAAATIGFAIAPCSLGFIIIAVSEQLIRSIMVGDDPEMLVSDLQNQFPHDVLNVDENRDAALVVEVVNLIERAGQPSNVSLDRGTPELSTRVWEVLQNIPTGSTANFTFLAEEIGALPDVRQPASA